MEIKTNEFQVAKIDFNFEEVKGKLKEFSENGKMIVKNHYTKDFYINRYKEIYKKLGEQKWQE